MKSMGGLYPRKSDRNTDMHKKYNGVILRTPWSEE